MYFKDIDKLIMSEW